MLPFYCWILGDCQICYGILGSLLWIPYAALNKDKFMESLGNLEKEYVLTASTWGVCPEHGSEIAVCLEHSERVNTLVLVLGLYHSICFSLCGRLIATGVTKAGIATEIIGYTTTYALGTGTQKLKLILVFSLICGVICGWLLLLSGPHPLNVIVGGRS